MERRDRSAGGVVLFSANGGAGGRSEGEARHAKALRVFGTDLLPFVYDALRCVVDVW